MQALGPIIALMLIMSLGWFIKQKGYLDEHTEGKINWLLFRILMPCSIFSAGIRFRADLIGGWNFMLAIYSSFIFVMILSLVLSRLRGLTPERTATSVMMSIRGNVLYVALPLLVLYIGEQGKEMIALYVAVGMLFYNFFPILAAQICLAGRLSWKKLLSSLVASLKNPVLLAGFAGILCAIAGLVRFIPQPVLQAINMLSQSATGLALLVIGASLELSRLRTDLKVCWIDVMLKVVVLPACLCLAFHIWPLASREGMIAAVIISSVSHAFNCYIFAYGMGMDYRYASSTLACATVLGLGTTAVWLGIAPVLVP
ncbi:MULTISPECIES: AEC family transporter [Jonquetella]|uniref:AEC family transporter n=1 Tax=Jonquetella TaxID=428711 RepID=UPI0001B90F00|nr:MULTISPECIES: AEC family transporter [Jonquetella]EEX49342.1 transporter, auxin efflux carrier (AEC) family protein [Jonquetella anthropi E3_33 E1]ERL24242.1 transporter, auxin efflux carrier domain protein [Jonquetella sp. BV3C21]